MVGKKGFQWEAEQQRAFDALKHALIHPPVLALPNQADEFIIDTDASDLAIGAELIQIQDGEEKVIAYGSYALTPEQRRYCVTRKELLAVLRFCRQYRYLHPRQAVRSTHGPCQFDMAFKLQRTPRSTGQVDGGIVTVQYDPPAQRGTKTCQCGRLVKIKPE